jgi:competence CoiA-like predicted nuclease
MLVANTKNKEFINLAETKSREELVLLKKQNQYYCPICNETVILKIGVRKRPHFAHSSLIHCIGSEGESEVHNDGKIDIYKWLKKQYEIVELEKYFPEINQRTDILLSQNEIFLCIEYQCSKIPYSKLKERTIGYKNQGIPVLWILGLRHLLRKKTNIFRLNEFSLYCMIETSSLCLFFYDPHLKSFIQLSSLISFSSTVYIGQLTILPLKSSNFIDLGKKHQLSQKQFIESWCNLKRKYRLRQHLLINGNFYPFKQLLYKNYISYMPGLIGVPLKENSLLHEHCIVWQGILYLTFIYPKNQNEEICLSDMVCFIQNKIDNGCWKINVLQVLNHVTICDLINSYLTVLEQLGIIRREKNGKIKKMVDNSSPNTLEEALIEDERICQIAYRIIFQKK